MSPFFTNAVQKLQNGRNLSQTTLNLEEWFLQAFRVPRFIKIISTAPAAWSMTTAWG
jgi:hypothetical protein